MNWTRASGFFGRHGGITLKLAMWTFLLVSLVTAGAVAVVLDIMEGVLLRELIRRGEAISQSVATPAGFSILAEDRLALDNLAAKVKEVQDDLLFLAVVDTRGKVLAHSRIGETGKAFSPTAGEMLRNEKGFSVSRALLGQTAFFEFRTPVIFSGREVGQVYLGIGDDSLQASRREGRRKILAIASVALVFGVAGTIFIAGIFTRPIKRLSQGVAALQAGACSEVPVTSGDELGSLTVEFNTMARELLQQKASLAAHARQLEEAYIATVRLLAAAIDARDEYTLGHSTRVAHLSQLVGRQLGLSEEDLRELTIACFLHDVGKIRVPDRILHKRGPLTPAEHACIIRHPQDGAEILRLADSLRRLVPAVLYHHERWDGRGYPDGLKGEEIPLYAAILAITDAYDAMTSSRPYRAGLSREDAVAELERCSGAQFAPYLVELFLVALDDYREDQAPVLLAGVA